MEKKKISIFNKIGKFVKKHKVITICSSVVVVALVVGGIYGADQYKKYLNTQKALELATGEKGLSDDELNALEQDGGFANFGEEIVDPNSGETVVLTQDENGNVVRTVVKDAQGQSTGAVVPEDHSHEHQGGGDTPSPGHQHSWVAHQATRQVEHVSYRHHDAVTERVMVSPGGYCCNTCGHIMNNAAELSQHVGATGHGGTHHVDAKYETRIVQAAYDEPITTYTTETYVDYYYCKDCGQRQ